MFEEIIQWFNNIFCNKENEIDDSFEYGYYDVEFY